MLFSEVNILFVMMNLKESNYQETPVSCMRKTRENLVNS
jgi:hypothetical protein